MATDKNRVTVDLTTGIGIFSFPRIFASTAGLKDDKVTKSYDIQILIPKTQRDDARAVLAAIKTVGEAKWGANWKQVRSPLRDGDKEQNELTEDGSLKGEKYPERLGHYFLNARSTKPVSVVDRTNTPIVNTDEVYGGCKGRINVTFYPYSQQGNHGIGVGLNGVQKVSDGESFGASAPSVESMFDLLDGVDDEGLDVGEDEPEEEPTPPPAKKAAAKRPAKKAAAKAPEPEPEEEEEEDDLLAELDDDV